MSTSKAPKGGRGSRRKASDDQLNRLIGRYVRDKKFAAAVHKNPRAVLEQEGVAASEELLQYLENNDQRAVTRDLLLQIARPQPSASLV